jgi:hypothetical protein
VIHIMRLFLAVTHSPCPTSAEEAENIDSARVASEITFTKRTGACARGRNASS